MPFKILNNHKFHYTVEGKGTPILFIHGLGSSILDWEKQIPFFAPNYKCISIDLRGHGQTKGSDGEYSLKQFAQDVAQLLTDEKETVHIVGISMGGMVALQIALDFPNLVKSLTIINSLVDIDMSDSAIRKGVRLRKLIPRILGMRMMGKFIGYKLFPHENQKHLKKLVAVRWAKNKTKDYVKSINAIAGWSVKNRLKDIDFPTLIIGAEFDFLSVSEKQAYTKLFPQANFIMIPDAGHAVVFEKPDEVNEVLLKFISSN